MPVRSISPSGVPLSMTIRAPVLTFPISKQARTSSAIVFSLKSSFFFVSSVENSVVSTFWLPICSSAFRSSGWKITMIAVTAMYDVFSRSHRIVSSSRIAAARKNARIKTMPFRSVHARVFLIQISISYTRIAIIAISIKFLKVIFGTNEIHE